jgi:hypothetical protein
MQKLIVLISLILSFSTAFADDSSSSGANSVPGADQVDELITNPNLRALSGSKSRWSMSNSINYDGGTISQPFGEGRPNIADASATSVDTDINDQISAKFSLTPFDALLAGFGVRKMTPFTGSGPSKAFYASGGKDVDLFDPSITYQHVYKWLGVQSVAQVGLTQYTRADIHSSNGGNLDKNLNFDQENIYEIWRFSIGASIGFGGNTATDVLNGSPYSRYQFWIDPYVEFKINDTFNFRTVANCWSYEVYTDKGTVKDTYTESVGLGISVTRDLFLYPNVQFLPGQVDKNLTNVGLAATLNLF